MTASDGRADPWVERLSEYVDGDLSTRQRRALESHLAECATCAGIVEDLRRLVADAPLLRTDSLPARDLWPGIVRRLPERPGPRAFWPAFSLGGLAPRLLAASVAVAVLVTAAVLVFRSPAPPPVLLETAGARPAAPAPPPDAEYDQRVASLEREARARLVGDPRVVTVLEENLASLDMAIANYRDALSQEPGDERLRSRLEEARRRKLSVLQQAVALSLEGTN